MKPEMILTQMTKLYQNFKINPSKLSGILKISEEYGLKVDSDQEPEKWTVYSSAQGEYFPINDCPASIVQSCEAFIDDYNQIRGVPEKEALDNLAAPGFEGVTTEEPQVKPPSEEKPLKNGDVKGGYNKLKEEAKEAKYEEVETPKKVNFVRPGRTIKGLTPKLAECGKIKIGIKGKTTTSQKGNSFRPPTKLDHFVVTTMDKTADDDFAPDALIMSRLKDPHAIPIRLPYDDPSLNFPTSYAYYDSAACQCRGDGQTAQRADGSIVDCCPETCKCVKEKKCKPNGVLSLILDDAPRVGGVYKFRTTGWNSINNLVSSMEFIRGLTNGLLAGLPLMLTLTPKHTVIPGTKTSTTIYMVNLEYRGSLAEMVQAIQQTMSTRALMQYSVKDFEKLAEESLSLSEAPEECKDIVEEFYPDSVEAI